MATPRCTKKLWNKKKHFFEMEGDVGMSGANYEKGREQDYDYYKHIILHPYIFHMNPWVCSANERCRDGV